MSATLPLPLPAATRRPHAPSLIWSVALGGATLALLSANPLLTAACLLALPLFTHLLWRPGEPPALLFLVLYQWMQVSTKVFHANVLGIPVDALAKIPGTPVARAVGLGLASLLVLACGQALVLRRTPPARPGQLAAERASLSSGRLFWIYLGLVAVGQGAEVIGWQLLPLMQVLLVIASLKWIPLFVLAHVALASGRGRLYLLAAVGIEVVLGFGGYFSSFKTVFFVLLLAALSIGGERLRAVPVRARVAAVCIALCVFALTVVWQGIKRDYRLYLNGGTHQQVVQVSWGERLTMAGALVRALDAEALAKAAQSGFERMAYVDLFAQALAYVPALDEHSGGEIWGGAVRHVLMPRALFPEKPVLPSDSEMAMRYTGRSYASGKEGTSVSLGYVAESYVDLGGWLMFAPIFLIGLLQGSVYRHFLQRAPLRLLGSACAVVALLPGLLFETASVKYLGGTLSVVIVLALLVRFVFPAVLPLLLHRAPSAGSDAR